MPLPASSAPSVRALRSSRMHEGGVSSAPVAHTFGAFPNPFFPATTLYYQIGADATVLLAIRDIADAFEGCTAEIYVFDRRRQY